MSRLSFELIKMPAWILLDDRHCRACDARTSYALNAVGESHTFPSCADVECQEVVKNKIMAAIAKSKQSA